MTTHHGDHTEYRQMLGRMLRSYAKRVATSSAEDLAEMMTLRDDLEREIASAVDGLRAKGLSWAEIAAPLGITRQSAQQRYGASFTRDAETIRRGKQSPADQAPETCAHGLSAWLCADPVNHYPADSAF